MGRQDIRRSIATPWLIVTFVAIAIAVFTVSFQSRGKTGGAASTIGGPLPDYEEVANDCRFPPGTDFEKHPNNRAIQPQTRDSEVHIRRDQNANRLLVLDHQQDRVVRIVHSNSRTRLHSPAFSRDGRRLAFSARGNHRFTAGEIVELNLDTLEFDTYGKWPTDFLFPLPLDELGTFFVFEAGTGVGGLPPGRTLEEFYNREPVYWTPSILTPEGSWYLNHEAKDRRGDVIWSDSVEANPNTDYLSRSVGWRRPLGETEPRQMKAADVGTRGAVTAYYWNDEAIVMAGGLDRRLMGASTGFRFDLDGSTAEEVRISLYEVRHAALVGTNFNGVPPLIDVPEPDVTICLNRGRLVNHYPYVSDTSSD